MREIALYNRHGQRLLTLRQAQDKGYGLVSTLKLRIHRKQLSAYKVGQLWLVREKSLTRPRPTAKSRKHRATRSQEPGSTISALRRR